MTDGNNVVGIYRDDLLPSTASVIIECDTVIEGMKGELDMVCIVGVDGSGEIQCASSHPTAEAVLMLERAKAFLLSNFDD